MHGGENAVVVLSHDYWQRRLGGDPGVLNQSMLVNGRPMTIVGVAASGFTGTTLGEKPDVFVPITLRELLVPGAFDFEDRRAYWAYLFSRLRPGGVLESAAEELDATYRRLVREVEVPLQEGLDAAELERFSARTLTFESGSRGQSSLHSDSQPAFVLLFAITLTVLVIACANVANLLRARGVARTQEMAIRGSLGASRGELLRQLLTEATLLAVLGGLVSLLVARWTLALMAMVLPTEVRGVVEVGTGPGVVAFAGLLALATGLLFGLYPALQATRSDVAQVLRSGAGVTGARAAYRFRAGLAIAQLAVSMVLLVAAGLFARNLVNIGRADLGLRADNVITFAIDPRTNGYTPAESIDLFRRTREALTALPGVSAVTASAVPLLAGNTWTWSVSVEGVEGSRNQPSPRFAAVDADYFSTLGIPLVAGREFTLEDGPSDPKVAVINEAFARAFGLPVPGALGMRIGLGDAGDLDTEIVGVVADARYSEVKGSNPPQFFVPHRQSDLSGRLTYYLRTAGDPEVVLRSVPELVAGLDSSLPVQRARTLEGQIAENVSLDRTIGRLSAAFAVLATLLAALGLYGVLAHGVAQRTREIGLRMALGAHAGHVRNLVLGQVARLALVGGAIGLVAALLLGRAAASFLYGLEGHDPGVLAAASLVITTVVVAAGYLPARRATHVDPMRALRDE